MNGTPIDREKLATWVEASCLAQGIPVQVLDPVLINTIGVLLKSMPTPRR